MKEIYTRILEEDDWQQSTEPLQFSCQEIELKLNKEEVREDFFTVQGKPGRLTEGYVSCMEERMECLTSFFSGTEERIAYRFHAEGLKEGEVRNGCFLILSNQGEYEIPFRVEILRERVMCSEGELVNLFQFTGLARNHWEEALGLFYRPEFIRLLDAEDRKYRNLYKGLSRYPGNGQNMEEFLVSAQKKQPMEYLVSSKDIVVPLSRIRQEESQICETIRITRNGWGFTRLRAETEGDFLSVEKKVLREEDFLGNQCSLPVFITTARLHEGKNPGRIVLRHANGEVEIDFCVVKERSGVRTGRRREMKRMMVELVELYQEYRMKKITAAGWRAQTADVVERMRRLEEGALELRLYQVHLMITEQRNEEAGRLMNRITVSPRDDSPELYCYYLYLSGLLRTDESFTAQVQLEIEEQYRMHGSWRIAWLLLFLSPALRRSASKKWMFLEEQFDKNGTSPVLYLEALHLLNLSPTLMMKLGSYEIQLLHYGARHGLIGDDLAGHVVYLAEKEKYYSQPLFAVLKACYEKKSDIHLLHAICSLLIKGNKTGPEYYEWYRLGVESELRVTRLYEYYMMSVDLEQDVEIPRIVLMYFAYQSNLEQEQCACLYAYIHRHRDEFPELYLAYRGQMDRFILQQLYRGNMNRHLAYLYQCVMEERMLTKDNCQALAPLLFLQQMDCAAKDIIRAVVIHTRLKGEQTYPVEKGRAYLPIYDRDYEILLEDASGHRYSAGRPFTLTRLMEPALCVKEMLPFVSEVSGFDLFVCESRRGKVHVTKNNAHRFRRLAEYENLLPAFSRAIRMELLRFYMQKDLAEELDMMLEVLQPSDVDASDLYEAAGMLVRRSFYEKAYAWLAGAQPERMDEKLLLRLCSRLLEGGYHVEEERMTGLAYSVFCREKYDSFILQHLAEHLPGRCEELLMLRRAADNFAVDTYRLTERLLTQLLYVRGPVMEKAPLLRTYLIEGGRSDLEAAYLHCCAGKYLMEGEEMNPYVLTGIARASSRGEKLTDMCALAYLEYYCVHRDERSAETDEVISRLGDGLIRREIQLPLFREYADILDGVQELLDKTMVVYRGSRDVPVNIHYRVAKASGGADGAETAAVRTMDMRHVYAGIYTASFVLFAGETLQYFITEARDASDYLASGELKREESPQQDKRSRYGRLNEIASTWLLGEKGEAQELLEQYLMTEWMTDGLFGPVQ